MFDVYPMYSIVLEKIGRMGLRGEWELGCWVVDGVYGGGIMGWWKGVSGLGGC